MEESDLNNAMKWLCFERRSTPPSSPKNARVSAIEQDDAQVLIDSGTSPEIVKRYDFDGVPLDEFLIASLPTNPGFYTDLMLGTVAANPKTSSAIRELCLLSQNARPRNEVADRVADHWDHVLEDVKDLAEEMRKRRRYFVKMAAELAECAKRAWRRREVRLGTGPMSQPITFAVEEESYEVHSAHRRGRSI